MLESKPDGSTKRRVVTDLKRSSGNDRASVPERIILPRIQDVVRTMRDLWRQSHQLEEHLYKSYGPDIGGEILDTEFVSIDFRDAFCHFANDRREWKQCITPDEKDAQALMWVAMTFGYKGAPLIMARLSSAVGRLIQSLLRPFEGKCQIYMDDLLIILRGPKFHRGLLISMILHVLEIFGVQVAHEKGERGTRVSWIGAALEIKELKTLVIGIQEKMIQELQSTMAEWPNKGMLPVKELRKVTGKLSWVAGILPRLKWIVNIFYGTLTAVEREEKEGTEASRAGNRGDTRPKLGLVAFKRISMAVERVIKLLSNFEAKLILERPLKEQPVQLGIVTDASPLGLGGMLIRLQADSEKFEILEAFEIRFLKEDAALLNVEHGAPSSQAVVDPEFPGSRASLEAGDARRREGHSPAPSEGVTTRRRTGSRESTIEVRCRTPCAMPSS